MNSVAELLQTGLDHQRSGRFREAEISYREVLRFEPGNSHALHLLGVIAHQTGNHQAAVELIGKAIVLRADVPAYHSNLGIALRDLGRPSEAEQAHRQALRLNGGYAEAWNNLGVALNDLQRSEEAEKAHREALRLQPDYADAWNNLGVVLRALERRGDAEAALREAIRLRPEYADAWLNLVPVLRAQNRSGEAEEVARQTLRLDPDNAQAMLYLASEKTFESTEDRDVVRIQTLLDRGVLRPEDTTRLHFALGKIHDDCRQWKQAFKHFQTANRTREESSRFDPLEHANLVGRIIAVFSESFIGQRHSFGCDSEYPVFIIGLSRSGKSLVERILASHPQVYGAGELLTLPNQIIDALVSHTISGGPYPECVHDLDGALVMKLAQDYEARLRRDADAAATRACDTLPSNYLQLGFIQLLFPKARVIHCQRDLLDNCLAIYFKTYRYGNTHSNSFEDIGAYYRQYKLLMEHWQRVLAIEMLELRYEDLTSDPEAVARELIRFLGLDWDNRCLEFQRDKQPDGISPEPIHTHRVGHSRHYDEFLGSLKHALDIPENTVSGTAPPAD